MTTQANVPNPVQVSLMRLFDRPMQPAEVEQVHQLLMAYYSELIGNEADEIMAQKGYTQADLDNVLNQSQRTRQ
jgi:hypothetical protein